MQITIHVMEQSTLIISIENWQRLDKQNSYDIHKNDCHHIIVPHPPTIFQASGFKCLDHLRKRGVCRLNNKLQFTFDFIDLALKLSPLPHFYCWPTQSGHSVHTQSCLWLLFRGFPGNKLDLKVVTPLTDRSEHWYARFCPHLPVYYTVMSPHPPLKTDSHDVGSQVSSRNKCSLAVNACVRGLDEFSCSAGIL